MSYQYNRSKVKGKAPVLSLSAAQGPASCQLGCLVFIPHCTHLLQAGFYLKNLNLPTIIRCCTSCTCQLYLPVYSVPGQGPLSRQAPVFKTSLHSSVVSLKNLNPPTIIRCCTRKQAFSCTCAGSSQSGCAVFTSDFKPPSIAASTGGSIHRTINNNFCEN